MIWIHWLFFWPVEICLLVWRLDIFVSTRFMDGFFSTRYIVSVAFCYY